jgi:hypothetical protein
VFLLFSPSIGYGFTSAEETLGSLFRGGAGFALAFKDFATKYLLLHYYWVPEAAISTTTDCNIINLFLEL